MLFYIDISKILITRYQDTISILQIISLANTNIFANLRFAILFFKPKKIVKL